jgi:hypothetical protein
VAKKLCGPCDLCGENVNLGNLLKRPLLPPKKNRPFLKFFLFLAAKGLTDFGQKMPDCNAFYMLTL